MAKRIFNGRIVIKGNFKGSCIVSKGIFNTYQSFKKSNLKNSKTLICSDKRNLSTYNKCLTNVALCLKSISLCPQGEYALLTACENKINPAAILLPCAIDNKTLSALYSLSQLYDNHIICVDSLGDKFLDYIGEDITIFIKEDGTVVIDKPVSLAF